MAAAHPNSFKARKTLKVGSRSYTYFSLKAVEKEVGDLSRLPFSLRVLLENLLRHEDGTHGQEDRYRRLRRLAEERRQVDQGDQLPAGARADAGLHRRAGGGRPRRHARRHGHAGRRRQEDQSAGAGRPRHRPFGDRRQFRQCQRLRRQREARVRAQPRALPVPALGPDGVRQFPRRAAGHRHLPPGQPRVPGPGRVDQEGRQGDDRLSRHAGRHRQPHHHGERPCACWAGASAASRPRPPCSASRCRW